MANVKFFAKFNQFIKLKNWLNPLLIGLGWLSVCLGTLGIFLPLLPTTPFLLLALWCFTKSSEKYRLWLLNHPKLGPFLRAWLSGTGFPRKTRNRIILILWLSMLASTLLVFYTLQSFWPILGFVFIGTLVTLYLCRLPICESKA